MIPIKELELDLSAYRALAKQQQEKIDRLEEDLEEVCAAQMFLYDELIELSPDYVSDKLAAFARKGGYSAKGALRIARYLRENDDKFYDAIEAAMPGAIKP
ncbi:MAG TPA: hypothetical protein VIZ86_16665 [Pseudomonas sp.]